MKKLFYIYGLALCMTACKVDNYDGPNAVITGNITDNETGELVASGGPVSGTIVGFFQNSSTQPLNFTTFPDGSFRNKASFTGNYSFTAEGPFTLVNTNPQTVTVQAETAVDIPVVPHVRLKLEPIESGGTTAKYKVSFQKLNENLNITEIGISWATYKNPKTIVYAGGYNLVENTAGQDLSSGCREFELTGLKQGERYYLRAFASTDNPGRFYNYSQQNELPIP